MARKIAIIGSASGSGKTTLAAELARRLGVPHVELDALHHGRNWYQPSADEFRAVVVEALEPLEGWVVDGTYQGKLGTFVLEQADTIVWLDLPIRVWLPRLWRRTIHRIRNDVELWNGNRESWRNVFLEWNGLFPFALRSHFRRRRQWPKRLSGLPVVRLRSEAEVERWLAE